MFHHLPDGLPSSGDLYLVYPEIQYAAPVGQGFRDSLFPGIHEEAGATWKGQPVQPLFPSRRLQGSWEGTWAFSFRAFP
ncbi:hypothetical protein SDC9_74911 [bioreactor metagenome]|uniref:Uncharacterized protein n=1 Tax=bioreactor metagenome TaxID=1076179 RepID=A0A644YJ72_9ZZZZ